MATVSLSRLQARSMRTTIVVLVVALHLAVLWLFWRERVQVEEEPESFTSSLIFFTLPAPSRAIRTHSAGSAVSASRSRPRTTAQDRALALPLMVRPSPLRPVAPEQAGAPKPYIDWSREAQQAAITELDREQQDARRRNAFMARVRPERAPTRSPDPLAGFRWDYAATHRLESSNGLPVWHVNDHCIVPLMFPLFFACAIGHIDTHGDLFDGMSEKHDEKLATSRPDDVP